MLDFTFKKTRSNDCENVEESIVVDELACSKNSLQNLIEEPGETPDADRATKDLVLQRSNDISLCIEKTYTQAERLRMQKTYRFWISLLIFQSPQPVTKIYGFNTLVYSLQVVSILIIRKWSLWQILRFERGRVV